MKFDNVSKNGDHGLEDKPEYTLIEYAYYLMASKAGVIMNPCRIYNSEGDHHFMTKRFDREDGKKLHMQSLGALAHISYQEVGVCGYELAVSYMKELGLTYKEVEQFYRRMVFNCLAVNQMTVNEKTTDINLSDLLEAGKKMDIKERRCKEIIGEVAVPIRDFLSIAESVGIKEKTADYISSIISENMIDV